MSARGGFFFRRLVSFDEVYCTSALHTVLYVYTAALFFPANTSSLSLFLSVSLSFSL